MNSLLDHYDVCVLGDHEASLLAASLLARLGFSVIWVEQGSYLKPISEKPWDPEPNFLLGMGSQGSQDGLLAQCLRFIGAAQDLDYQKASCLQVFTPQVRLFWDEKRCFLSEKNERGLQVSDGERVIKSFRRVESEWLDFWNRLEITSWQDEASEVRNFLIKRPWHYKNRMKSLSKKLRNTRELFSAESENLERGIFYQVVSHFQEQPKVPEILQLLMLEQTAVSFPGGLNSYRLYLRQVAEKAGVHFLPSEGRLRVSCRRLMGLQMQDHFLPCSFGILGCGLNRALENVICAKKSFFVSLKKSLHPVFWRFTISLIFSHACIPEGRSLWQEDQAPPLELESFVFEGKGVLYLRTWMPFVEESLHPKSLQIMANRMYQQAKHLYPFLERDLAAIYPDFRDNTFELEEKYSFDSLNHIPENLMVFSGQGLGIHTGLYNVWLSSQEAYPELGSLGPTLAALESVAWIARASDREKRAQKI